MTPAHRPIDFGVPIPDGVEIETSARDYTPPQYLTLLLTDLGVLTPSVVSDELIQLYLWSLLRCMLSRWDVMHCGCFGVFAVVFSHHVVFILLLKRLEHFSKSLSERMTQFCPSIFGELSSNFDVDSLSDILQICSVHSTPGSEWVCVDGCNFDLPEHYSWSPGSEWVRVDGCNFDLPRVSFTLQHCPFLQVLHFGICILCHWIANDNNRWQTQWYDQALLKTCTPPVK